METLNYYRILRVKFSKFFFNRKFYERHLSFVLCDVGDVRNNSESWTSVIISMSDAISYIRVRWPPTDKQKIVCARKINAVVGCIKQLLQLNLNCFGNVSGLGCRNRQYRFFC